MRKSASTVNMFYTYVLWVSYLFSEKGGLVGPISGRVASTPHGFHMGDSHTQDGQFIRFSGQGTAGRDHVRQLSDVLGHFVAPASLNLTVILSKREKRKEKLDS